MPGVPAHAIAKRRMMAMMDALSKIKTPPPYLNAAVSFAMDMHVPLASSTCSSVHICYRKRLAPEYQHAFPATLAANEKLIMDLWSGGSSASHPGLKRLLRKGGPFCSSVRYVHSQIKRGLEDSSTTKIVATIIRLALLGNYPHAKTIADPALRMQVYNTKDVDMLSFCTSTGVSSSQRYFYIIGEYVSSASMMTPCVWGWLRFSAKFASYDKIVRGASDNMRAGKRPPRVLSAIAPRSWAPTATASSLCRASATRKKLSVQAQHALTPDAISRVYKATILGCGFSYIAQLEGFIGDRAKGLLGCKTESDQRRWFALLDARDKAVVQVYCHATVTKANFNVFPLSECVTAAQRDAATRAGVSDRVIVCICCSTWRSKGVPNTNRATIGIKVKLPPTPQSFSCNGCRNGWGLRQVSMVGAAVRIQPKLDSPPVSMFMCCNCATITSAISFVGVMPTCRACARTHPTDCFVQGCRNRNVKTFSALDGGTPTIFAACDAHVPRYSDTQMINIEELRRGKKARVQYARSVCGS